jgi:hypothetical protein
MTHELCVPYRDQVCIQAAMRVDASTKVPGLEIAAATDPGTTNAV